ncbi:hypothetical protein BDW22DRAFT_1430329 [Trametopsis cervina]|nr:hypothetical protein BDW22DRAFT_1430329 [Trametopsis cervina]
MSSDAASRLITALSQTRAVSYSEVASVTVLAYDVLITMSDELECIWNKRWTAPKALYIAIRYLPLGFQLALLGINVDGTTGLHYTLEQCKQWVVFQGVVLQLVITTVDIVFIMRVYALYNKSRVVLIGLSTLLIAEVAYLSYNLATVTPKLTVADDCFVRSSPKTFILYWIVSLIFETILFALTVFKFIGAVKAGWGKRPVMKEFVQDGTWAFALVFVTMCINSALYHNVHSPLAGICFTWLQSVLSFAGSRLILNPRKRTSTGTTQGSEALSGGAGVSIAMTPLSPVPRTPISRVPPGQYFDWKPANRDSTTGWDIRAAEPPRSMKIHVEVQQECYDETSSDSGSALGLTHKSEVGIAR